MRVATSKTLATRRVATTLPFRDGFRARARAGGVARRGLGFALRHHMAEPRWHFNALERADAIERDFTSTIQMAAGPAANVATGSPSRLLLGMSGGSEEVRARLQQMSVHGYWASRVQISRQISSTDADSSASAAAPANLTSVCLARGSWQARRRDGPSSCLSTSRQGTLSAFERYATKYACNGRQRKQWLPAAPCDAPNELLPALRSNNIRTLWFLGDSVLMQMAFAAGCRARHAESGVGSSTWSRPSWAFFNNEKAAGGINCVGDAQQQHRVCFLTTVGHHGSPTITQALKSLIALKQTRATDVAVVTPGAWRVENASRHRELVAELVSLVESSPSTLPRVVYQEPLAAHFPTAGGWWKPGLGEHARCSPLSSQRPPPAIRAVADVLEQAALPPSRLAVLHSWAWSAGLSDMHMGVVPGKALDCTHYCLSGGVADGLLDALMHLLQQKASSESAGVGAPIAPGRRLKAMDSMDALGAPLVGVVPSATSAGAPRIARFTSPDGHSSNIDMDHGMHIAKQPKVQVALRPRRLALCLFGVAGVQHGKAALQHGLSTRAVFAAADSHVRQVLEPAEARGWSTSVFAHSWAGNGSRIALAVDSAYGSRFAGSRHDRFGLYTMERVTSMLLSITTSLRLARSHASRLLHAPFHLVLLARHDVYFFQPLDLEAVDPAVFTTPAWCAWVKEEGKTDCGKLTADSEEGVLDLFFMGGQVLLETTFGSMQLSRMLKFQRTYSSDRSTDRLDTPEDLANRRHNSMAHYVVQAHLAQLGLRARGLTQHHPSAVVYITFGLYRERDIELDASQVPSELLAQGPSAVCSGRNLCKVAQNESREKDLERRWDRSEVQFQRWLRTHAPSPARRKSATTCVNGTASSKGTTTASAWSWLPTWLTGSDAGCGTKKAKRQEKRDGEPKKRSSSQQFGAKIKDKKDKQNKKNKKNKEPAVAPPDNFDGPLTEAKCNAFKDSARRKECLRVMLCRTMPKGSVPHLKCGEVEV